MIRHSQSYLFGAISGTAVIAAAVVFFILLVSAQALRDWPISDLSLPGSGNTSTSVSPAQSLGGGSANAAAESLNGPISVSAATVAPAAKAGGGANHHKASGGNQLGREGLAPVADPGQPRGPVRSGPAALGHLTSTRADERKRKHARRLGNSFTSAQRRRQLRQRRAGSQLAAERRERRNPHRASGDEDGQRNLQRRPAAGAIARHQHRRPKSKNGLLPPRRRRARRATR